MNAMQRAPCSCIVPSLNTVRTQGTPPIPFQPHSPAAACPNAFPDYVQYLFKPTGCGHTCPTTIFHSPPCNTLLQHTNSQTSRCTAAETDNAWRCIQAPALEGHALNESLASSREPLPSIPRYKINVYCQVHSPWKHFSFGFWLQDPSKCDRGKDYQG